MTTATPDPATLGQGGLAPEGGDRPWTDPDRPIAERVELLLARLTLAEKVAQLGSAWEDVEPAGPEVAGAKVRR